MAQDFVIRIRADDAATATVKKIQAALGKVTEPVDTAQKRLGRLGNLGQSSVAKVEKALTSSANAASKLVDKIVEIIPGLAAMGSAASLAGLSALAVKFGNFGFSLNRSSKLLGMNAQDLAAWHVAAKRAGVSAEEFDSSMSGSQMAIRAAANGSDPHAMAMLQRMGVQIARNKDGTVDYYNTQLRLMKAIAAQKTVEAQRDVAGTFSMGGMLPMIQQGTYDADKQRAMRKGLIPTSDEIARAVAFHQNINDLEDSVAGLGNAIGSRLVPILDPVVKRMAEWLDQNRAKIADQISGAVQKLVDWLSKINWDDVAGKAKELWDNLGGLKGVALLIAAIKFAGPIGGVLNLISALVTLTSSTIPAAVGALGTLGAAGVAAWGALQVAKLAGLPDVDRKQGIEDVRNGEWAMASAHLSAGDFARALAARAAGKDNAAIAMSLEGGINPADSSDKRLPLGIRSNNPLNMLDHGKEINYSTSEEGIAAAVRNLEKGYRGLTLTQIQDKWTGGARTGNTPQQIANYAKILSSSTGLGSGDKPDLNDPAGVGALVAAMIYAENGKQPYSPAQIGSGTMAGMQQAGIQSAMTSPQSYYGKVGNPASDAPDAGHDSRVSQLQQHTVTFDFQNVPAGARVDAKSADGAYMPTRINYRLDGV